MRSRDSRLSFATLTDFVSYFLDDRVVGDSGPVDDRVLINSLSYPLFVARKRAAGQPNTTLFWQELMPGAVPENMVTELEQPTALTRIVFCDQRLLRKVVSQHPDTAVELTYLSHLGQFADKEGYHLRRAFTLTNSDEIPALVDLLETFPEVTFSVAALTLMSQRLHELAARYANLTLTPTINLRGLSEELDKASVYLDINAGSQVLDVVRAAYYLDLVVLALTPYAKAPDYSLTFSTVEELKEQLAAVITDPAGRSRALDALHTQHGPRSTPADYRRLLSEADLL
ncbi:hypothetical protein GCM10027613_32520 [Microlunatus endophyticus]